MSLGQSLRENMTRCQITNGQLWTPVAQSWSRARSVDGLSRGLPGLYECQLNCILSRLEGVEAVVPAACLATTPCRSVVCELSRQCRRLRLWCGCCRGCQASTQSAVTPRTCEHARELETRSPERGWRRMPQARTRPPRSTRFQTTWHTFSGAISCICAKTPAAFGVATSCAMRWQSSV